MVRRVQGLEAVAAVGIVAALGLGLATWNILATPAPPPWPIGTCVTAEAGGATDPWDWGWARASCDGPHTHVVTAWLPGLHQLQRSRNPCPSWADIPSFVGDGVACFTATTAAPSR